VGLLSEEYDVRHKRLVGNFPQAFSHIALVNAAFYLEGADGKRHQAHPLGTSRPGKGGTSRPGGRGTSRPGGRASRKGGGLRAAKGQKRGRK
jgi:hypothetical protein